MSTNVFDKSKPMPDWIRVRRHDKPGRKRGKRYYKKVWRAQPPWADTDKLKAVYKEAARLRREGHKVDVDHIVPLASSLVCGLHVHYNLRIIERDINRRKANDYWPNMPYQQRDLFEQSIAPDDFYLEQETGVLL